DPGREERPRIGRAEVAAPAAALATLADDAAEEAEHGPRMRRLLSPRRRRQRPSRDRDRRMGPLRSAALLAARLDGAGAQVGEELAGIGTRRGRGPRSADVDAGVVVGAADAGDALHLGELSCGSVELVGPGAG